MKIHCAHCGRPFEHEGHPSGGSVECPHCRRTFDLATRETIAYAEQAEPDPEKLTGLRLGGYLIDREIGRGGMGIVYEGVQESLDRKVAIKVLFRDSCKDPQFVARFEREAESLARLSHPNIVNILDRGCEGGIYFFVMEYVDGLSLRVLMDRGPMDPAEALLIIPVLCEALEYAHGEGIIHRDIKPENILIDRQGRVKIADFGLSRIVRGDEKASRITRSNMVMGTPDYMAPEQRLDSKGVDHRADIYSLGVIFYEMLTGELPLGHFPPPSKKDIRIDIRLDDIILKVLDKDPELRYQRASDIATDIHTLSATPGKRHEAPGIVPEPPRPSRKKPAPGPRRSRTFLEVLEDGWESWVLVVAVVLTLVNFFPNVIFLIGWFALYKTMRQKRLARLARSDAAEAARSDAAEAAGSDAAGAAGSDAAEAARSDHPAPAGKAPPSGDSGRKEESPGPSEKNLLTFEQAEPAPRTSLLALLTAVFGMALIFVIPIFIPFESHLAELYRGLTLEQMAVTLSMGVLVALPGLLGLLISVVARTRIAVHGHLGGAFLAMLGLIGSVIYIGFGARQWYKAYEIYGTWTDLKALARSGDPRVVADLHRLCADPVSRDKALKIAGLLPLPLGRDFFAEAAKGNGVFAGRALEGWAEAYPSDPHSRSALLARVQELLGLEGEVSRVLAVKVLGRLPGDDARPYLIQAGKDASPEVREEVAEKIRDWQDPRLADLAENLTLDPHREVAEEGFDALEHIRRFLAPEESVGRFVRVLRETDHARVRYGSVVTLRLLSRRVRLPEDAVSALGEAARGEDPRAAEQARRALREILKLSGGGKTRKKEVPVQALEEKGDGEPNDPWGEKEDEDE